MLCKFGVSIALFEVVKMFLKSFVKVLSSLTYIYLLAVFTSQLAHAISVKCIVLVISNIVGGGG
jgi:hypothetical protein